MLYLLYKKEYIYGRYQNENNMGSRLKKLAGYVGYLLGSVFITFIWLIEKIVALFKLRGTKEKV
jgi:hypothetical protein